VTDLSNTTISTKSGAEIRVGNPHGDGGQGVTYMGAGRRPARNVIVKQFTYRTAEERAQVKMRTAFLAQARLTELSAVFAAAPFDWFEAGHALGHVAGVAPGQSFDALLQSERWAPEFLSLLQAGEALACAIGLLHERGWAHGDLQPANVFIDEGPGGLLRVTPIDFDNFFHPSMPAPQPTVGQIMMLAPEHRTALSRGEYQPPDQLAERYMLTVLLHWLVLLHHPAGDVAGDPDVFDARMRAGTWDEDPARGVKPGCGGYSPEVLNVTMQNLFRRGFSLDRDGRPAPREWAAAFANAVVWICPRCGSPAMLDRSKTTCPFCRKRYPLVGLVLPDGRVIAIDGGGRRIGRDDLGGAASISRHHANFERFGGETRVVNFSANGLYRRTPGGWVRFADGVPEAVQPGDRLRFAEAVEVTVRQID
jgi:hypothetical protein